MLGDFFKENCLSLKVDNDMKKKKCIANLPSESTYPGRSMKYFSFI